MTERRSETGRITTETSIDDLRLIFASRGRIQQLTFPELSMASEIAYRASDWHTGVIAMKEAATRPEATAPTQLRLGRFLWRDNKLEQAEEVCRKAIDADASVKGAYALLIEILVSRKNLDEAIVVARTMRARCEPGGDPTLRLASLLVAEDRLDQALDLLQEFNDIEPPTEPGLMLEANVAHRLKDSHAALLAAERAYRLWPSSRSVVTLYANLLHHIGRYKRAAAVLEKARKTEPGDATLARLHSMALMKIGASLDALRAAITAIKLDRNNCENWYMAGVLADSLGYGDQATMMLREAIKIAPDRANLYITLANVQARSGNYDLAVELLDEAEKWAPDQTGIRDLRLNFLAQNREFNCDAEGTGNSSILPLPRSPDRERSNASDSGAIKTFLRRFGTQSRIIYALAMREIEHETVESRFGIAAAIFHPLVQIAAVGLLLSIFNHGRPPIGDRMFFFYATGLIPLYMFVHVVGHSLPQFQHVNFLQIPIIQRVDLVIGVAVAKLIIEGTVATMLFATFALMSYGAQSDNQIESVAAYLVVWLNAFGFGMILAVFNSMYRATATFWTVGQRALYVMSGVMFIPEHMPGWMREILLWNPLLQCIEWFRTGMFPQHVSPWLNKSYAIGTGFGMIVIGFALEAALRHKARRL